MSPSEDAAPPSTSGAPRTGGAGGTRPLRPIRLAGFALFIVGFLIAPVGTHSVASRPQQTVGTVLCAGGLFVYAGLLGALVALGHPWAAAMRQRLEQGFNHPRLIGLTQVWTGVLAAFWVGALLLHRLAPDSVVSFSLAVLLVGLVLLLTLLLIDRRR